MIFRRIGTNEVDTIQICHGNVEAQQEDTVGSGEVPTRDGEIHGQKR
jgi:hypothetical protein